MKSILQNPFEKVPYFTLESIKQAMGIESPNSARVLLYRWMQAEKIIQLKRGTHMARRFYGQHRTDPLFPAMASAILLP